MKKTLTALALLAAIATAQYEGIRITEIMFHPSSDQLDGNPEWVLEWIEIQNTGSVGVQMEYHWELIVVGQGTMTLTGPEILWPGEYAVIPMSVIHFKEHYGTGYTMIEHSGLPFTLGNDSQTIMIKYIGQTTDMVHYYSDWGSDYGDTNAIPDCNGDGASLERANALGPSSDPWNWESSTDEASGYVDADWPGHYESWGTPCAPNTCQGQALQASTWGAIKTALAN